MSVKIFISYSHKDEALRKQFDEHLGALRASSMVETWHDAGIPPGDFWEERIFKELEKADLILLLVSPSFLNSTFCREEMTRAFARAKEGHARVIPILLRDCAWQTTQIEARQGLPPGMKPIVEWKSRDSVLAEITRSLFEVVKEISTRNAALTLAKAPEAHQDQGSGTSRDSTPAAKAEVAAIYSKMRRSSVFFAERFASTFPGLRGMREFQGPDAVTRLGRLLRKPITCSYKNSTATPFWWFRGHRSMPIEHFVRTGPTTALLDWYELKVRRLVAFQNENYYRNFIYLETDAESPTGIYEIEDEYINERHEGGSEFTEEYAIFEDHLISRAEYDDGFAEIDNEIIDVRGKAQLRVRLLTPSNRIICAQANPLNNPSADGAADRLMKEILLGEKSIDDIFNFIQNLPRSRLDDME